MLISAVNYSLNVKYYFSGSLHLPADHRVHLCVQSCTASFCSHNNAATAEQILRVSFTADGNISPPF